MALLRKRGEQDHLGEQWKLSIDLGTEASRSVGTRVRANFFELGAIFAPNEDVDLALGVIRSHDNDNPRTVTTAATLGHLALQVTQRPLPTR